MKSIISSAVSWYWVTVVLVAVTTITMFTVPDGAYPFIYLREGLGFVFMLYMPGFTFTKALFSEKRKDSSAAPDTVERVALNFGMSLALVPIVGLILDLTPFGIRLPTLILSLLTLTLIFATAAVLKEQPIQ